QVSFNAVRNLCPMAFGSKTWEVLPTKVGNRVRTSPRALELMNSLAGRFNTLKAKPIWGGLVRSACCSLTAFGGAYQRGLVSGSWFCRKKPATAPPLTRFLLSSKHLQAFVAPCKRPAGPFWD